MPREPKNECPHPALSPLRGATQDAESESFATWSRYLVQFYHDIVHDIGEWTVKEVRWYKNIGRLEHEYLVLTVEKLDEPDVSLFLRFDRRCTSTVLARKKTKAIIETEEFEKLNEPQKKALLMAVKEEEALLDDQHYVISSLKKSSSLQNGVQADDTVTHTRQPDGLSLETPERAQLMATYSGFRRPFYLRDLALIIGIMTEYSDTYLLLLQQCYWMARTIVNIVTELYQPDPVHIHTTPAFARAGTLSVASFLGAINKDNPTETKLLVNAITAAIMVDDEKINAVFSAASKAGSEREKKLEQAIADRDQVISSHEIELAALRRQVEELQGLHGSVGDGQSLAPTTTTAPV